MSQEVSSSSSESKLLFKWIDHTNTISDRHRNFYDNKEFIDVTVISGPDSIRIEAHKIVLSASSDYFLAALRGSSSNEIKIPEVDGITMKMIVDFMYTASIEIRLGTVRTILKAAKLLQMKALIDACCEFLAQHLDVTNCLGIALFAEQENYSDLFQKATSFAYMNLDKVSMGTEFAQLNKEELIRFLSREEFRPASEESAYRSLVPWVKHDQKNREKDIYNLCKNIWFGLLKRRFTVEKGHSISDTIESYESFCRWLQSNFLPKSCSHSLVFVSGRTASDLKMQIFNRQLNSWSVEKVPPVPKTKTSYGRIVLNNKLIIIGGTSEDTVECLDLETKEWSYLPPMKHKRSAPGIAVLNGHLYVIGGDHIRSVEKYNFATREWQDVKPLNRDVNPLISTAVLDGKLYITDNGFGVMECYDPVTDQWTGKTLKNKRVQWFGLAAVGPYLYTVGGHSGNEKSLEVERYDPATDTWAYVAPLKKAISNVRCTALNNRLVVCGGEIGGKHFVDTVQEYNPETDEWKLLAPFNNDNWSLYDSSLFAM